jgi:pimeloyl-ACP methyl ester carboxylesterase
MHMNCQGTGDTTVVLEAGLMDFSIMWAVVQPSIASFTRVCSYDRSGLGWSQASSAPRSAAVAMQELREVLDAAGVVPPYVMVGHSYGGLLAQRFARRYPDEVVGLVLVDAAHVDQLRLLPELAEARRNARRQFRSLRAMNALGLLALMPSMIPTRGLPGGSARRYQSVLASSSYFRGAMAELDAMEESFSPTSTDRRPFGGLPVVVVSRGLAEPLPHLDSEGNRQWEAGWQQLQRDLVALSGHVKHLVAERSGHDIHTRQPEIVVAAIRSVLSSASWGEGPGR